MYDVTAGIKRDSAAAVAVKKRGRANVAVAFRADFCVPLRGNADNYNWREST